MRNFSQQTCLKAFSQPPPLSVFYKFPTNLRNFLSDHLLILNNKKKKHISTIEKRKLTNISLSSW